MTAAVMTFAYDNSEQRIIVEQRFREAQTLMRQGLANMIEAGGKFALIRNLLRHNKRGGFDAWIEDKGLGRRTVYRIIELHAAFATVPHMAQLDIAATAAYLLAMPSVPDEARAEALQYAAAGERITVARAQAIVDQYRPDVGNRKLAAGVGDPMKAASTTPDPERTEDEERLAGAVRGWLGGPAVGEMSVAQLQHAARLTGSALDLEGWHARRAGGRNYDWEALVLAAGGSEVDQGRLHQAVEQVRGEVAARLRQIEDGVVADDGAAAATRCSAPVVADPGETSVAPSTLLPAACNLDAEPALTVEELGAIVQAWLEARMEENEIPDDRESQRLVLRGILNGRSNGFAPHWKSLRAFGEWPEDTAPEAMLAGVRAALTHLTSPRLTERRQPSWAGVTPTRAEDDGPRTYTRARPLELQVDKQLRGRLARQGEHIRALLAVNHAAVAWLKRYLQGRDEPDEGTVELLGRLERTAADVIADE